jgi:MFS family permease
MAASPTPIDVSIPPASDEAIMQEPTRRWRLNTFNALRHRNYRLYFFGQMISIIGSWVQTTALMSLAYTLGEKPSWPATIAAASLLPTLFLGAWAGTLVDRWPKRALIFTTQALQLLLALLLAAIVLFGDTRGHPITTCWILAFIALVTGIVNSLDLPARLSFVIDMVGREDLVNAVALNSMLFNTARAIGPFFAAVLLTVVGPGYCFLLNGLSFLAVLAALAWMDVPEVPRVMEHASLQGLREAVLYVLSHRGLFYLLLLSAGVALLGWPVLSLLVAISDRQLNAGDQGYAYMLSGVGLGALIGAFFVATFGSLSRRYLFLGAGIFFTATSLICLALVHSLPQAVLCCVVFGMGPSLFFSTGQSTVQLTVTDANRNRVLGIWSMVTTGTLPVGNLLAGLAADRWGVSEVTAGLGIGVVLMTALVLLCARQTRETFPRPAMAGTMHR